MEDKVKNNGGTGKAILAFFLGVLFGIILLIGAIVGGVYYVAKTDLNKVLGWFNVDNGPDENGENTYINTDEDKDGVANIIELVQRVVSMADNVENLTIGQIDSLVPAAHGLVDQIIEAVQDYVTVDYDKLSAVKFSEFEAYFSDLVLDIRPAVIVEKSDSGEINKLMDLVLYGVEADCITVNGTRYPLYRDTVTGTYIYSMGNSWYIAEESEGTFFATGTQYQSYNEANTEATGNYYTVNGERIIIVPITIRSLVGTDGLGALGKMTVAELMGDMSTGDNELVKKVLGDVTLDDLINGNVDLEEEIDSMTIGDIIDAGDNKILQQLSGYTIGELASAMDELEIVDFIEISADNSILAYVAYGITQVDAENGVAQYKGERVQIETELNDDGTFIITGVYYSDGRKVEGTKINDISDMIAGLNDEITIGDLMGIDESNSNAIMKAIKNSTINSLAKDMENLTINELYAESIYADPVMKSVVASGANDGEIDFSAEYLYYEMVNGEYKLAGGTGKVENYADGLYTYGATAGFWKLLIVERGENGAKSERVYTINGITEMSDNATNNLQHCSLDELCEAGVLVFSEDAESPLGKTIPTAVSDKYGNRMLGSLTISEAVDFVASFLG